MKDNSMDLGKEKVSVLFRKLFFPTVLSMISISAVTTIDGIFVGHGTGSDGIAAVNICIPLLMLMMGIGLMVGMGCSVVASIYLSKGKPFLARVSVMQALTLVTLLSLLLLVVVFAFPSRVAFLLGTSDHLLPQVIDYLLWFSPSLLFELVMTVGVLALRLDGAPKFAMWCTIVSSSLNVVLDWLFIFPFGWGVMGAAFATTISCFVGAVPVLIYLAFYARHLRFCSFPFNAHTPKFFLRGVGVQCKIGMSALFGEATMAVLMFIGNQIFMRNLGDAGVGAFGVSCYYLPFVFMIGNAIAQSAQPVISYNFGMGEPERVRTAMHMSLLTAIICGMISTMAFALFPELLVGLFLPISSPAAQIAIAGFPYYGSGFVFFVLNLAMIGYYQSVERVLPAISFSLLRGFVFLVPSFLLLPSVMGIKGIWLALPLSEMLTTAVIVGLVAFRKARH